MKSKKEILEKIKEIDLFESECELMAECIASNINPKDYSYDFETFDDLDLAFSLSPDIWMEKSVQYFKLSEVLNWVLKD